MGTGNINISGFHQLHERICQIFIVRCQCKRNVVSTAQPVLIAVQVEKSVLYFKRTESGSFCQAIQLNPFVCDQAELEIVQIGVLRCP